MSGGVWRDARVQLHFLFLMPVITRAQSAAVCEHIMTESGRAVTAVKASDVSVYRR